MKTVFISIPWFHPAFRAGGPVQSVANLVNEFHTGIKYKIFCGNTDLRGIPLENIETGKWVYYNDYTEVWYAKSKKRGKVLLALVENIRPAVIFIIGMYSWHFTVVPLLFCKSEKKIISVRGMLYPGALSEKSFKKKIYLAVFKLMGFQKKVIFHATDLNEKDVIVHVMGKDASVAIAGNYPGKFIQQENFIKKAGNLQLITVAIISPMKNYLLVLKALEKCRAGIDYHICGPVKDTEYWEQCLHHIKMLPANIIVHYHGEILPQQVPSYLHRANVFILPSKSENFGHALFEALNAGLPVITSFNTPWNELRENKAGINCKEDAGDITSAIDFFASLPEIEFKGWSDSTRFFATNKINVDVLQSAYADLFA